VIEFTTDGDDTVVDSLGASEHDARRAARML
jgi:hypothetical protein